MTFDNPEGTDTDSHHCPRCLGGHARAVCFDCSRRRLQAGTGQMADRRAPQSPFVDYNGDPARVLDARQVAHRRRMLAHMERRSTEAC